MNSLLELDYTINGDGERDARISELREKLIHCNSIFNQLYEMQKTRSIPIDNDGMKMQYWCYVNELIDLKAIKHTHYLILGHGWEKGFANDLAFKEPHPEEWKDKDVNWFMNKHNFLMPITLMRSFEENGMTVCWCSDKHKPIISAWLQAGADHIISKEELESMSGK